MKIDIQNLFLFIGFIQCILLTVFALTRKQKPTNQLFAVLLIVLGLSLLNSLVFFPSYYGRWNTVLDYAVPELIFLIGPVTYFYTRSLFEKNFKLRKSDYYHFAPAFLDIVPFLIAITIWSMGLDNVPRDGLRNEYFYFLDTLGQYMSFPQFASITIYLFLSWKYLKTNRPIADTKTYRWSRDMLIGVSLIDVIWLPYVVLSFSPYYLVLMDVVYLYPIFYTLSAFFYYLTYRMIIGGLSNRPNPATKAELEERRNTILQVLSEGKLYGQSDLNLKMLSGSTGIREDQLSFIFKHYYKKGFNQFLNEFRVQKALEKMEDKESNLLSVEGIGMEVGFASRTTFYRSFKQKTGKTPAELLKR